MPHRENGPPPKEVSPDATNVRADTEKTATPSLDDSTCPRCAIGTPCVCSFYSDWAVTWPAEPTEAISVQLQRRRLASYRCARLESSRRDPISRSIW